MSYQEARLNQAGVTSEVIAQSNQDMYLLEIDDFANCIFNGQSPKATGEDGRAALQVALAAIESMRYGRPVSLR
jgi:myo-inositol 2-dehydrogenase/D-chiro-inositol 1-dehydrogenase